MWPCSALMMALVEHRWNVYISKSILLYEYLEEYAFMYCLHEVQFILAMCFSFENIMPETHILLPECMYAFIDEFTELWKII